MKHTQKFEKHIDSSQHINSLFIKMKIPTKFLQSTICIIKITNMYKKKKYSIK